MGNVVPAAFSEEQAARLTGISKRQLQYWASDDFYSPTFSGGRKAAFGRVYSFKDIVNLRVIHALRNQFGVSLQHLRQISARLAHLEGQRWTGTKLWVVKKRVVWQEPGTDKPQEVLSGQYIVPVVLEEVIAKTENDVAEFNKREDKIGLIKKSRYVSHNAPMIAGTRIPVSAVKSFHAAGYSVAQIISEYPDLTEKDVEAAIAYELRAA